MHFFSFANFLAILEISECRYFFKFIVRFIGLRRALSSERELSAEAFKSTRTSAVVLLYHVIAYAISC